MAKEVHEWAIDDATNAFAPADGGAAENWTGKDVNNAARARMGAMARWFRAQEFARTLFNEAPYGAKAITFNSTTQFQIGGAVDRTALFPVGRRIRAYDAGGNGFDVFVSARSYVAPNTIVDVRGGPALPNPISDIGFTTNPSLGPF